MKIQIHSGRTVHHGVKAGKNAAYAADGRESSSREAPVVKKFTSGSVVDLPDDEAKALIARGAASKYESPKAEAETAK